jgi:DNA-binding NtrC family response regulator/tetratricopeptide (TPR) repeat protein
MSEDALTYATVAFHEGHYTRALDLALKVSPRTKRQADERQCLISQCLQYTGELESAVNQAEAALRTELGSAHTARYWEIIGRVRLDEQRREEAARALRQALRAAERSSDTKLLASVQQVSLITFGENLGSGLTAAVREAYRTAVKSADPAVLASFHIRLAQLEGQRGTFPQALHHLGLAESLLKRCNHAGLTALYHVNLACVLTLGGSYRAARKHAETGTSLAEQVGHVQLALAGATTAGHIAVVTGDLSVAESWLRKARKIASGLRLPQVGLLDSLAHLALLEGQDAKAEEYVSESRRIFEAKNLSWITSTEPSNLFTELHLHKKRGDKAEQSRVLRTIRLAAESINDRHCELLVTLAEAEALFEYGDQGKAREKLLNFLDRAPTYPIYRAEASRMLARDLWASGHKNSARRRLLRAAATAFIRGTRIGWGEALQEVHAAGPEEAWDVAYGLAEQTRLAESKFKALQTQLPSSWYQETLPSEEHARDCLDGFDDAASILEISQDAELRAREALATAIALDVVKAGAVISRADAGARIIARYRWPDTRLDKLLEKDLTISHIEVGRTETGTIELALKASAGIRAVTAIAGLRRLLEAAKALESQKKDQQRLGALWQPEVIIEEPGAVFSSPQMIELMTTARKVAATSLPVLLMGDTGTGKEVLARAIHRASQRANKIFLPFNCSAVPRDMVESQLFGYRRGSFTGAHVDFPGIIRSAEGGTLFLDEIGELSMDLQPKLLRFLETNEVHPLGEGKPIKVDVRVIAATNADLDDLIQLKEFREDLYYRLNIVRFHMPPLSERREEIPPLATHLLRRFEMDEKKHGIRISDELMEYLLLYNWPGNVRQLSNELRKMVAMVGSNETLTPEHIAPAIRATRRTVPADPDTEATPAPPAENLTPGDATLTLNLDQPLPGAVEALERALIEHAIARADGRMEDAARLLGISRKGLFLKRRRWQSGGDLPADQR